MTYPIDCRDCMCFYLDDLGYCEGCLDWWFYIVRPCLGLDGPTNIPKSIRLSSDEKKRLIKDKECMERYHGHNFSLPEINIPKFGNQGG